MRRKFASFAWIVLAVQILVILWGAYVRASKSGAGCGEHWPLCQGQVLPTAPQLPTIIEFTHRITSGVALVLVIILVVRAFRLFPAGGRVRRMAGWSGVFIITESLVGAALVLLGHTALNPSVARGFTLSIHLVNTMFLLGSVALTAWWAGSEPVMGGRPSLPGWKLFAGGAGILLAGVVGAIAALGDTLFAPGTVMEGLHQDFVADAHPFVRIRIFHPILAALAGLYLLLLAARAMGTPSTPPITKRLGLVLIAITLAQFAAGGLNILLLVPIPMQMVHLFLADALWIAFVFFAAESQAPSKRLLTSGG